MINVQNEQTINKRIKEWQKILLLPHTNQSKIQQNRQQYPPYYNHPLQYPEPMQIQLPATCSHFLFSIDADLPTVKLYKYRHFLSTHKQVALHLLTRMTTYALQKQLLGQYQAIYQTLKQQINRTEQYKHLRQSMIDYTNPIRSETQHAQSIANQQQMIRGYYKLAEYYRKMAMHKQAIGYYNKLFRTQTQLKTLYQKSQYFSSWAQELYFDNDWTGLSMFIRNQLQDPKLTDATLATIKDLKFIEMGQSSASFFFVDLLSNAHSVSSIISNQVISYIDLGIIYSLVALATKQRHFLKIKTPWSGKLQVLYLQNKFRELLQKIHQTFQHQGKFHPLIDKIYPKLVQKIRERILRKYLQIYQSIPLIQLQKHTTYTQGSLKIFLQQNPSLPYLIDPITRSVIYYPRTLPLYDQAAQYSHMVKDKFREILRNTITAKRVEEMPLGQGMGRGGLRGMFGAMMDNM